MSVGFEVMPQKPECSSGHAQTIEGSTALRAKLLAQLAKLKPDFSVSIVEEDGCFQLSILVNKELRWVHNGPDFTFGRWFLTPEEFLAYEVDRHASLAYRGV